MNYLNAEKGIRRIFTAEVLAVFGALFLTITGVLGTIASAALKADSEAAATIYGFGTIAFGIAGVVLLILAFILNITGIAKAGNDEESFKIALWFVIIGLVSLCVSSLFSTNQAVAGICESISKFSHLCTTIFIINGIRKIALNLNREDIDRKGNNIYKIILCIYILVIIAEIIATFFQNNFGYTVVISIITAAGILEIVQFILYLIYLSKAKKMIVNHNS